MSKASAERDVAMYSCSIKKMFIGQKMPEIDVKSWTQIKIVQNVQELIALALS
jgi:hypothetical protein